MRLCFELGENTVSLTLVLGGQWGRDAVGAFLPFHLFPGCPYAPDSELKSLPIKYRPIPRQVHFLSDGSVIVTFLAGIMYVFELNEPYEILTDVNVVSAFEIDISGKWKYSWRLSSSGDCMYVFNSGRYLR